MPVTKHTARELRRTTELLYCMFSELDGKTDVIPSHRQIEYVNELVAKWTKAATRASEQWGKSSVPR